MSRPFLWLHIRKAGGTSIRQALGDKYRQVDRYATPHQFIALPKAFWNDNLNNYRVPLGGHDFRRMLFAKTFLYNEQEFSNLFKFAIVRNPYSRMVSAWRYLTKSWYLARPRQILSHYRLGHFLERLPEFWENIDAMRHPATHTAPMWDDVTDDNGKVLLDFIGKLENIDQDFEHICRELNVPCKQLPRENVTQNTSYRKYYNKKTRLLVEKYFWKDINEFGYEF